MTISNIENGESLATVRGKLNADIERGNKHGYPNQKQLIGFGNSITAASTGVSFAQLMAHHSNGKFVYLKNAGIDGNTTPQMVARLSDIDGADAVTIMEAANDAENSVTFSEHVDNMNTIYDYCEASAIIPYMLASPTTDANTRGQYIHQANLYDYVNCRKRNIPMYNPWDFIVTDDGAADQKTQHTLDGVHPNSAGHNTSALALYDDINNDKHYTPLPIYNDYTIANVILNPNALFIDQTSGTPDNWLTTGATSETLAVTSLGIGNTYTVKYVNGPVNFRSDYFPINEGDTYMIVFKLAVDLISGEPDLLIKYDFENGPTNINLVRSKGTSFDDMLVHKEVEAPAGATGLRVSIYALAGTYEVDISLAQLQMYNLTHYGL